MLRRLDPILRSVLSMKLLVKNSSPSGFWVKIVQDDSLSDDEIVEDVNSFSADFSTLSPNVGAFSFQNEINDPIRATQAPTVENKSRKIHTKLKQYEGEHISNAEKLLIN